MRHRIRGRRRGNVPGVLVAVALAASGAALIWQGTHTEPPPAPLPSRTFERQGAAPATPRSSEAPTPPPPLADSYAPDRLLIPSLGVDAQVVPEPVAVHGELVVPGDPLVVGRWTDGAPVDGEVGTTLLAGHVNVTGLGLGALSRLHEVNAGTLIITTDAAGRPRQWAVDSLIVRTKDALPPFPPTGERRLAVVTCGGPLLDTPQGRSYRDNVIVFAAPLP